MLNHLTHSPLTYVKSPRHIEMEITNHEENRWLTIKSAIRQNNLIKVGACAINIEKLHEKSPHVQISPRYNKYQAPLQKPSKDANYSRSDVGLRPTLEKQNAPLQTGTLYL
jgi:hypothetical protein